jgi:uncharacterized protein with ATP-grasp and redox domains
MVRLVTGDEQRWPELKTRLLKMASGLNLDEPPGTYTARLLVETMQFLGEKDPFRQQKAEQNRQAAQLAAELDRLLGADEAGLRQALMVAAAGNVIDVGPGRRFELKNLLNALRFAHDDSCRLIAKLKNGARVLYILDNSGEVEFDRLVFRRLPPGVQLTIVARSFPILNDVTVEEARALGLEQFGRVIGTGSPYLGIDFQTVSPEFSNEFRQADLVIAKGHANFESLVDGPRDGYYLLTAKCELVAARLKVQPGDPVCFYADGKGGNHVSGSSDQNRQD